MKLLTVRVISRRLALPAGVLVIGVVINSQLLIRAQAQDDAAGFQVPHMFPRSNPQPQNTPPDARRADTQAGGNISGAVLDQSGAVSVGAKIRLSRKGQVLRPDAVSAIASSVICKGDNKRWQPNYSFIAASVAVGGISNLYVPARERDGAGTIFGNALIRIGQGSLGGVLQEFVLPKLTPKVHHKQPAQP